MTRVVCLIGWPFLWLGAIVSSASAQSGQAIFEQKCVACHSVGSDRLIGPGLAGVLDRRDRSWVKQIIMEPDRLLNSGDSIAAQLLAEYQIPMMNLGITDAEAEALLSFLGGASETVSVPTAPEQPATEAQVLQGQALFQGTARFANGGPTCNSCHEVTYDAVIGGGALAADLTTAYSRLGGSGVRSIMVNPPFPVMQRAYEDKTLTDEEVVALVGFLQRADDEQAVHQPRAYGRNLFFAGVLGTAVLFGLSSLAWSGRLKGSVNQSIYDRQVKST